MRRSFLVASAAAIVLAAREGAAEPAQGHGFRLGLSPWSIGTYDVPNSDGHYSQKGVSALEARLGYGYRATRNLELGALASRASVPDGKLAIVPRGAARSGSSGSVDSTAAWRPRRERRTRAVAAIRMPARQGTLDDALTSTGAARAWRRGNVR